MLHCTDRAAVWTTTGQTSFQILIGLNIEISFMFLIYGIVFVKFLPPDPAAADSRDPEPRPHGGRCSRSSRSAVEVLLWAADVFHWEYWWWNFPNVTLIVLLGYATFFAMAAWVYDMRDRHRQLAVVGTLAAIDVTLILCSGVILEWI